MMEVSKTQEHNTITIQLQVPNNSDLRGGGFNVIVDAMAKELKDLDWHGLVEFGGDPETDWDYALFGKTIKMIL